MAACISGKPPTVATHLPIVIPPNGMRGHAPWHGHPMARVLPLEVTIKRFRYGRGIVPAMRVFLLNLALLIGGVQNLAQPFGWLLTNTASLPPPPPPPYT